MVPENIAVGTLFELVSFPHQGGRMQGSSAVRTLHLPKSPRHSTCHKFFYLITSTTNNIILKTLTKYNLQ